MLNHSTLVRLTLCTIALGFCFLVGSADAQTRAFTYQGKLSDTGNPVSGHYDFEFRLFDALSGGVQQGTTLTLTNINVTSGIFSVQLDFGACPSCFNGDGRFLDITVRVTGGGVFTPLTPRQEVTSNPYAIQSRNAGTADGLSANCTNCVTSSQIQSVSGSAVTGAIPVGSVPSGSTNYIQNTSSPQGANFNISGNGSVGGSMGVGTSPTSKLHVSGTGIIRALVNSDSNAGLGLGLNNQIRWSVATVTGGNFQIFNDVDGQNALWINTANNNVGLGTTSPVSNLHVNAQASTSPISAATIDVQSFGNAGNAVASHFFRVRDIGSGSASAFFIRGDGNVGISTETPNAKLHIVGTGLSTGLRVETEPSGTVASFASNGLFQIDSPGYAGGRLEVLENGNVRIGLLAHVDPRPELLSVGGEVRVNSCVKEWGGAWIAGVCLSDERLKRNIEPFDRVLEKLVQMQPVHFDWRSDEYPELKLDTARSYGLIAQDVEKAFPEMVIENPSGFKAVNYSELPLFLLQAIRELKAENEGLRKELRIQNQQLQTELQEIRARLGIEDQDQRRQ